MRFFYKFKGLFSIWRIATLVAVLGMYFVYQDYNYPSKKKNFVYRMAVAWDLIVRQEYLYPPCITPKGAEKPCEQNKQIRF